MAKSQTTTSPKKRKQKVSFGANGRTTGKGKRKSSPDASSTTGTSSRKKARTNDEPPTTGASGSTDTASANTSPAAGADAAGNTSGNNGPADTASAKKRVRNPWGIRPKEVPETAKSTQVCLGLLTSNVKATNQNFQRAFQRFIRGLCGLLSQSDTLPSAIEARNHYDRRFDKVDDYRAHMRTLVDESRTAIAAATDLATKLVKDAKRVPGPIANDIARIPEPHLATVFTMVLKAGLQGFCPDVEGPVQSAYNQLHRHLAVSGFQFLAGSLALAALDVNVQIAKDTSLLNDMFDHYVYGTLAQRTRMETRRPGSLSQSLQHSVEYKARTRVRSLSLFVLHALIRSQLAEIRFKTASRLKLRKPVQRMAFIKEAHSDDEHTVAGRRVRQKPGRNHVVAKFFRNELDVPAEEYRKRNAKQGQRYIRLQLPCITAYDYIVFRPPKPRTRPNPLLPASEIGMILPPDVPIDFFTPVYYNALTMKDRARYANTGVAFPLEDFVFDPAHEDWRTMGKQEFMEMYGNMFWSSMTSRLRRKLTRFLTRMLTTRRKRRLISRIQTTRRRRRWRLTMTLERSRFTSAI